MGKRLVTNLVCLLVVAAAGAVFYDLWYARRETSFQLAVRLEPKDGRQVVRVWPGLMGVKSRSEVENLRNSVRYGWTSPHRRLEAVEKFDQGWFEVTCDAVALKSGFGREVYYKDIYEVVTLKVEFADGETQWVVVEVPEGRGDRRVTVPVP